MIGGQNAPPLIRPDWPERKIQMLKNTDRNELKLITRTDIVAFAKALLDANLTTTEAFKPFGNKNVNKTDLIEKLIVMVEAAVEDSAANVAKLVAEHNLTKALVINVPKVKVKVEDKVTDKEITRKAVKPHADHKVILQVVGISEAKEAAEAAGLGFNIVSEDDCEIELTGTKAELEAYIKDVYSPDDEDAAADYISTIELSKPQLAAKGEPNAEFGYKVGDKVMATISRGGKELRHAEVMYIDKEAGSAVLYFYRHGVRADRQNRMSGAQYIAAMASQYGITEVPADALKLNETADVKAKHRYHMQPMPFTFVKRLMTPAEEAQISSLAADTHAKIAVGA